MTSKALLDADIQEAMGSTTYRYTPGNGDYSVTTRSDAVFLLSLAELGQSDTNANVDGSALPIANTLKVAYLNGSANTQWTRSPRTDGTYNAWGLYSNGDVYYNYCGNSRGSRPTFTLPSTALVDDELNVLAA